MRNNVFVDTSGWAEILDDTLPMHHQAEELAKSCVKNAGRLVTTDLILIELTALLTSPLKMPKARQIPIMQQLRSDASIVVISAAQHVPDAWHLWENRQDKDWSMVDCVSFVVMQKLELLEAITSDHDFEQAGFVQLLK
ncbi:MAG: PIN domain-containing protein [Gemmatales bacterium]